ncbi:MAG TPA: NAD(+)/NADH kinase [Anaerohalosphaeraceae bacterium]|nr:NAD(+)/NADH kinase [Phycisphaerae bacterium]HOK94645.1 NAD(+)/NADH kinase [Anaerohalosphaeraceae bacterium]HOL30902.1 NAD(+)/NADH kinase [Anaerohalosphaeraceae bacterium]HOM76032.1 NAD(+)/NADH kinase [Anaerohalosphaeraceae bacterium]HPC64218.1 NAD(+)/NADH kinase [Anaerohalosphaeraceae bacterium]
MKKPKFILFADPSRPHAVEAMERFTAFAGGKIIVLSNCLESVCPLETLQQADFAVVFGGDGTILGAARQLCQTGVPVIGVNVGKLGFLAEFSIEELQRDFERILMGQALIEKRMILHCQVLQQGQPVFESTAVNDAVITAGPPFNMIELELSVQGQKLALCIGDGVIVSTPTGTTAYNLSAGGPILSANLAAVVITPICPHSLSFRPIVINAENQVRIVPMRLNEQTTLLLDGQVQRKLSVGQAVLLQKHPGQFRVVNNPRRTQWETLASKLNWAEKPRYSETSDKLS